MKYMTFNSSCSYAGLANMLEKMGIDVEDYEIALAMKLPFMIDKNEDGYIAGPMLQQKKWFDVYLNAHGYEITEEWVDRSDVFNCLQGKDTAMLGIRMDNGRLHYHAVVFKGMEDGKAAFMNNKHEGGSDPDEFKFTANELEERVRDKTVVATITPTEVRMVDFTALLEQSLKNLDNLQRDMDDFCAVPHSNQEILEKEFGLFRPLLLDGPSMMKIIGQDAVLEDMKTLQKVFVQIALKEKRDNVVLADCFDMELLRSICERWKELIGQEIKCMM
ncbi:MAG: hypothetical protein IJJ65_02345 [Butyrivibrio sp.]|nr:hypothetical protein [Butyrivibrio sp.]